MELFHIWWRQQLTISMETTANEKRYLILAALLGIALVFGLTERSFVLAKYNASEDQASVQASQIEKLQIEVVNLRTEMSDVRGELDDARKEYDDSRKELGDARNELKNAARR